MSLGLAYACLEGGARLRFHYNNPQMPSTMRQHMGVNRYEASKLVANFDGHSITGIHYRTNEFGFRCGTTSPRGDHSLLLGGDSRIFGWGMEYTDTVAGMLEEQGLKVHQQALPAGSPAFFNHEIFELGLIDRLQPRPATAIYAYDPNDPNDDHDFVRQMGETFEWYAPRRIKLILGGFFWNMLNVKLRSFVARGEEGSAANWHWTESAAEPVTPETVPSAAEGGLSLQPQTVELLDAMHARCDEHGVRLILLYLPRRNELISRHSPGREAFARWCESRKVPWIDAFAVFDGLFRGDVDKMASIFIDIEEGIHFNREGSAALVRLIQERVNVGGENR